MLRFIFNKFFQICLCLRLIVFSIEGAELQTPLKFNQKLMGTDVTLIIDADDCSDLHDAVRHAYKEGNRLNMILSDWEADSELSVLSRSSRMGAYINISEELFDVLSFSRDLSVQTAGAFDITVGPLSRLWRIARHQKKFPNQSKLEQTLRRTGYKNLELYEANQSARLTKQNMVLDLGAVAKGYIADRMLAVLMERGFPRCLIDAGGDLTIGDPPRSKNGWSVKIGGLANSHTELLVLSNCAVATSGDLEQFLEINGKIYSHIINPKTGVGMEGRAQVSVVAKRGMIADALASTCLVIGFDQAKAILSKWDFYKLQFLQIDQNTNEVMVSRATSPSWE